MKKANSASKDSANRRREMIDEFLNDGFTPEQIMIMAQSREKDKQEEKKKETDIKRAEDEIKAKFDEYIKLLGVKSVTVDDLYLDDLFNIIKGESEWVISKEKAEQYWAAMQDALREAFADLDVRF